MSIKTMGMIDKDNDYTNKPYWIFFLHNQCIVFSLLNHLTSSQTYSFFKVVEPETQKILSN